MIDEELLKPSREHLAALQAKIKAMEAETAQKVDRYGRRDREYAREAWGEYYRAVEPMRREAEAVAKVIADYYALHADLPPVILPAGQGSLK